MSFSRSNQSPSISRRNSFSNKRSVNTISVSGDNSPESVSSMRSLSTPKRPNDNPKKEIMARKEQKRLEEESNYTYTPRIKEIQRRKNDSENDPNRFNRLYVDALKRHIEKLESDGRERSDEKDLTFRPMITTKARSLSASRDGRVGERLYNTPVNRISSADSDSESQCSFKPTITKRARSIDRSENRSTGERLYDYSKVYKERKDKIAADSRDKLAEKCTFAPRTNTPSRPNSRSASPAPSPSNATAPSNNIQLTERMKRFEYDKCRKLEEAIKKKKDQEIAASTFTPVLFTSKRSSTPTGKSSDKLAEDKSKKMADIISEVYAENTFKPQLVSKRAPSPNTRQLADYKSIHERLYKEGEERKREASVERDRKLKEQQQQITYKPTIFTSKPNNKPIQGEEEVPVFQRLAATDGKFLMEEILTKIKSELELRDCTFKPKLVTKVKSFTLSDEPIHMRLNQEAEALKAEQVRREAEKIMDELSSASFSPMINPISVLLANRRKSLISDEEKDVYKRLSTSTIHHVDDYQMYDNLDDSMDMDNINNSCNNSVSKKNISEADVEKMVERLSAKQEQKKYRSNIPPSPGPKSIQVNEQEVERIVDRLYSQKTKSYECALNQGINSHELEAMYNKKVILKNEKELQKVFRKLSSPADDVVISFNDFIVNPMSNETVESNVNTNNTTKNNMHSIFFNQNSPLASKKGIKSNNNNNGENTTSALSTPKVIPRVPKSPSATSANNISTIKMNITEDDNYNNNIKQNENVSILQSNEIITISNSSSIDTVTPEKSLHSREYFVGRKIPSLADIDKYVAAIASNNNSNNINLSKSSKPAGATTIATTSMTVPIITNPEASVVVQSVQETINNNNFVALKVTENMFIATDISPATSVISNVSASTDQMHHGNEIIIEETTDDISAITNDDNNNNTKHRRARSQEFLSKVQKFNNINTEPVKPNFGVRQTYLDATKTTKLTSSPSPRSPTPQKNVSAPPTPTQEFNDQKHKVLRGQKKRSESNMQEDN